MTPPGNSLPHYLGKGGKRVSKYNNDHGKFEMLDCEALFSQSGSTVLNVGIRRTEMSREQLINTKPQDHDGKGDFS